MTAQSPTPSSFLSAFIFFFTAAAACKIYTLSLDDALPIFHVLVRIERRWGFDAVRRAALALARDVERRVPKLATRDRKSTRLNSSHITSSYAVFCLKKKNQTRRQRTHSMNRQIRSAVQDLI